MEGTGRLLDSYIAITAPLLRGCCVFLTVAVAWFASSALGAFVGLIVEGAVFLVAGIYCLANFIRCREAHCILTGVGWLALGAVSIAAAVARLDDRSATWIAFLVVAVIGHGFEAVWRATHGTNSLRTTS